MTFTVHQLGRCGALGVHVEHDEGAIAVVLCDSFHALKRRVKVIRRGGRWIHADTDQRLRSPCTENVPVFGVCIRHEEPFGNIILNRWHQRRVKGGLKREVTERPRILRWKMRQSFAPTLATIFLIRLMVTFLNPIISRFIIVNCIPILQSATHSTYFRCHHVIHRHSLQ